MIEIYYFDIESISEYQLQKAYSWISEDRKKKARRYKFRDDEKRCVFGEALVRYGLLKKGYEKDISIFHNSFGKPYMGKNDTFFNISHAGNWVSVAFSDDEIGIDIEKKIYDEDVC
ncbi:4'-phosphopantetheinyl transferase family protein [Butyrivibrio sp. AE3004]|uniref:4'-phosphopantetheinyl transferase family protein n=1 Tax=Butyrivibrio sp. AE3004 TaxID=1506994 RepID=UPI00068CC1B8|nr:hypothetical protein [Butyrivibrio sp. AE3004]